MQSPSDGPFSLAAGTVFSLLHLGPVGAQPLWYNGNLSEQNGLINPLGGVDARLYDDFHVARQSGWQVSSVWSNDFFLTSFFGGPPNVSQAAWSLRSNVSAGDSGIVIAEGISPIRLTATGLSPRILYSEYTIKVTNLSVFLPSGTYSLQVTPLFTEEAFLPDLCGTGVAGTPGSREPKAFFNSPGSGSSAAQKEGFASGAGGAASSVPEPSAFILLSSSGAFVAALMLRRRYHKQIKKPRCHAYGGCNTET